MHGRDCLHVPRVEASQVLLVRIAVPAIATRNLALHATRTSCFPARPQLCRQFRAGNLERTEVDVNISEGFVQRKFEPLAPAVAASS